MTRLVNVSQVIVLTYSQAKQNPTTSLASILSLNQSRGPWMHTRQTAAEAMFTYERRLTGCSYMSKEISLPNNRVIELNWNMCQLIFLILKILHNGQFFLSFLFPFFQLYFSSLFIIILKIFRNGIHGYFLKTALIKKQSENLKVGRWNVFTCKTFSFIYIYIDICTLQRKHFPVYALQSQWQSLKQCYNV